MTKRCSGDRGARQAYFLCVLDEGHEGGCEPYVPPTVDEWRAMRRQTGDVLDALEGMVAQHCADGERLDSMGLSANCEAMELLADLGRVVLDGASVGRRAIGRWPAPTPEEEAAKVAEAEAENARRAAEPPRDWQAEMHARYDRATLRVEPFGDGRFGLFLRQPEGGGESAFGGLGGDAVIVLADGTEVPLAGTDPCPGCGL